MRKNEMLPWIMLSFAFCFVNFGIVHASDKEYELEEIVVTATRSPRSLSEVPQGVELLYSEDITAAGGEIEDALDSLPALHIHRSGSALMSTLPTIRGSQPGQVLVLLDGRRLNSQQSGWFNLSDLPVPESFIDRIEILEGSSSALYGAEAMGGVINIITRDPMTTPGSARLTLGSGLDWSGSLRLAYRAFGGGFTVGAGREVDDGYRPNGDGREDRFNFRAAMPGSDWLVSFSADLLRKELGSPGPEVYPTPKARQYDDKNVLGLKFEFIPDEGMSLTADAFWNRYRREYEDPEYGLHSRHVTHTGGASLQGTRDSILTGRLTAGLEILRDNIESTDDGEHHLTRLGFFIQDEWDNDDRWAFFLNGRYDDYSIFDSQLSPRAALTFKATEGFMFRGSVSRGYRTPTFDDLYWDDPYAHGNPDLEPERAWSYEGAVAWERAGHTSGALSCFRRDVDDLINWQDEDGDWVYSPQNISSARIQGFSGDFKTNPWPWLTFSANYTYLHPENRSSGEIIGGRPRHMVKSDLRLSSPWLETGLRFSWIDRYTTTNLEDASYALLSVSFRRSLSLGGYALDLGLEIENMTDRHYEVVPGYPMPRREVTFTVGCEF